MNEEQLDELIDELYIKLLKNTTCGHPLTFQQIIKPFVLKITKLYGGKDADNK